MSKGPPPKSTTPKEKFPAKPAAAGDRKPAGPSTPKPKSPTRLA